MACFTDFFAGEGINFVAFINLGLFCFGFYCPVTKQPEVRTGCLWKVLLKFQKTTSSQLFQYHGAVSSKCQSYRQEKHLCAKHLGQGTVAGPGEQMLCCLVEHSGTVANSWALPPGHITPWIAEIPPSLAASSLGVNLPFLYEDV